ncbi:MAG: biopolymer transporter ExbD [Bdellovibrionales bacterium]|nr:biopolymer transporter ExbD [Bdellovibrionales bacterium]
MAKTYKRITQDADASFDLDLTPMLALIVNLIPIMLLSTVFVRVMVIESPLPQVVQKALDEDRNKKDREVTISLDMKPTGFVLQVKRDGQLLKNVDMPKQNSKWDLVKLHSEVARVKAENPTVFRMDLNPDREVAYDEIVKVIDEVRKSNTTDPKIQLMDKETNKLVETDLMFPDVVFANVVEG